MTKKDEARARGDFVDENNPPGPLVGEGEDDDGLQGDDVQDTAAADDGEARRDPVRDDDGEDAAVEEQEQESAAVDSEEIDEPGEEPAPITIPKARFDEAQKKARDRQFELERRIAEMEKQQVKQVVTADVAKISEDLDVLETKYEDLLLEGEVEKARAVRRDMRKKENDLFDMRMREQGAKASSVAVEQMRFDSQLAQFEAKFPAINPDSDDYNAGLAEEVADMMNVYLTSGYNKSAALNKAVHYIVRDSGSPQVGEDPSIVRSKRAAMARKRVSEAAKKSPPDIKDKGRDSDKTGQGDGLPDVTKMSIEQFEKLSTEQLKRLRNDSMSDSEVA